MRNPYSEIAAQQLDALEAGPDVSLYNAVLDHIELILNRPSEAQEHSAAIQGERGIALRLPVVGYWPYKVFWTSAGPDIEAVLRYP